MFPFSYPCHKRVGDTGTSFILLLDYCSPVWSGAAEKDLSKLQLAKKKNKAAKLALAYPSGCKAEYRECACQSLMAQSRQEVGMQPYELF